ncbi:MAG: TetR/AcrR family transcriptional regulator [Hyphomonadaceae bacterium]
MQSMAQTTKKRSATAAPVRGSGGWLSRTDWIRAGQELLCEEGIAGMRLIKLTKRLKVSTGSFYHHFVDMEDYLAALADFYKTEQVARMVEELKKTVSDPRGRIRQLAVYSHKTGMFRLDAAMRVWAASDERAANALRASEVIVIDFMTEAFIDAGFTRLEASLRATILLSVQVVRLLTSGYASRSRDLSQETLSLLLSTARSRTNQKA